MKTIKMAALGAALVLGAGTAFADTDQAEIQQFLAYPQSITQAITAAEAAAGGKAMEADWEDMPAAYHIEVVKPDGTLVDVIVAADGTTQMKPN